tara:strand:- start:59 stop:565 length:507 start_codon:yes stop_codon:yes gene_type:complete
MGILKEILITPDYQMLPFRQAHIDNINIPWFESQYIESLAIDETQKMKDYETIMKDHDGLSYTFIQDGEILLCFGISLMWRGVGEFWIMPSDSDEFVSISVINHVTQMIDIIIEQFTLNRIHIQVRVANERTLCFINSLGFDKEGLMKKYGPEGGDYFMLSKTINREK